MSYSGIPLIASDPAIPCGLVAKSFFNDTYVLMKPDNVTAVPIDETNIAWDSDVQYKFNNIKNPPTGKTWQDVQWLDMKNGKYLLD